MILNELSFSPQDGAERVIAQLQSTGPMKDIKTSGGNNDISRRDFVIELSNVERKWSSKLLEAEIKDIPFEFSCPESLHNTELVKTWKEVLNFLVKNLIINTLIIAT